MAINMYTTLVPEHEHMVLYTARRANSPADTRPGTIQHVVAPSGRAPGSHRHCPTRSHRM